MGDLKKQKQNKPMWGCELIWTTQGKCMGLVYMSSRFTAPMHPPGLSCVVSAEPRPPFSLCLKHTGKGMALLRLPVHFPDRSPRSCSTHVWADQVYRDSDFPWSCQEGLENTTQKFQGLRNSTEWSLTHQRQELQRANRSISFPFSTPFPHRTILRGSHSRGPLGRNLLW